MFQIYRPTGRLFCWVLAVMLAAWVGRSVAREASAIEPEMPASHPDEKPRVAEPAPRLSASTWCKQPHLRAIKLRFDEIS